MWQGGCSGTTAAVLPPCSYKTLIPLVCLEGPNWGFDYHKVETGNVNLCYKIYLIRAKKPFSKINKNAIQQSMLVSHFLTFNTIKLKKFYEKSSSINIQ